MPLPSNGFPTLPTDQTATAKIQDAVRGPFTVAYNTHFYYPAHCWKCWGAPTTYWDAISMIQPVAAPKRTFLEQ